jgi:GT2 family glycosyltransferase
VLLLNSDATAPPDLLERLDRALAANPRAGIAGPVVLSRTTPDRIASLGMRYSVRTGRMRHLGFGASADGSAPSDARSSTRLDCSTNGISSASRTWTCVCGRGAPG